jgi:hypothetical protein
MECIGIRLALVGFMDVGMRGERDQTIWMNLRLIGHPEVPASFWKNAG